jgi:hypothetical protein
MAQRLGPPGCLQDGEAGDAAHGFLQLWHTGGDCQKRPDFPDNPCISAHRRNLGATAGKGPQAQAIICRNRPNR